MKTLQGILIGLATAFLAACAQPSVPQDHFYRLQVPPPDQTAARPRLAGTLEVTRLAADGLTGGRPVVYSEGGSPLTVNEYHYHFWTEPPAVMLQDQLVAYLRTSGVAQTVVTPELRIEPDFLLTGKIKRLERVIGESFQGLIELELGVRERDSDRLVLLKSYREEINAQGESVAATVAALNEALIQIFSAFLADLSKS